ncbi:hypothetical protein [Pseudanabaena phage PA-SR01]|nr:hypothetical protein [Pseudanabaena phage PA-SR01]
MSKTKKEICHVDGSCPFACSEASDIAQNYGCLPTAYGIKVMRIQYGKTWACHSDPSKPCQGAVQHLKRNGEDASVIDPQLITEESDWGELVNPSEEIKEYIESKFWSY